MPAPTFKLPVSGSAPNQYATETAFDSAVNAALGALWTDVITNGGKSFSTRANAVAAGQAGLPVALGLIYTRENSSLVVRGPGQTADDPLFATYPNWGVVSRIDPAIAMRDAGLMTLANVAGTADALTAELPQAAKQNGVTATSSSSVVEIIPALSNTGGAEPTLSIDGGAPVLIRSETNGVLAAGQLAAGRSYLLRRRGPYWRVISGAVALVDLLAARSDRIVGNVNMGTVTLETIAGSGDAITASVPSLLTGIGVVAANLRRIRFAPIATNSGAVTINIDGQGAQILRDANGQTLAAGFLVAGRYYEAVKVNTLWRLVAGEVSKTDLSAEVATVNAELRSGRVWQYASNGLTIDGANPPTGTQCIDVTKSVGTESAKWVRASAPSDGVVTDTLRRDGTGNQWWRRASSSQVLRDDMYDGAVKRVVANNLRPSGITVPAGAKVLVITKGNAPGEAIWATIGRLPDLPETDEYAKDLDAKWWILRWSSEWVARDHPTFAQMQAALATVSGSGSGGGYTPPEPLPASATLLPRRVGGVTQLVGDAGIGAAARYTVGGDGAWHWLPSRVAIVMVLGQSNAAVSEMEGPPLYIPAKTPDFVMMSNDGVGELGALRGWNGQIPSASITGFVPAAITGVQSSAEALASASNALDPRGAGMIYAGSHGRGGAGFTATDPNFAIWKVLPSGAPAPQRIRMIEWVTAVMTHAAVPPTEIVIAFTHGETNRRDPWATYTADGLGYMADIEADLAFTGLPVVWLVDIPGGTTAMSAFGSDWQVKYALRELMRQARLAGHKVVDVGPRYHLPMGTARGGTQDHIHTSYLSQVRLREMDAFAYRNHVAGLPWWCAFPKGERAAGLGNKVILAVESLTPIMIDRDMVPRDPHFGFSLSNDSATITGVEQTGDREITLSLSGTPNSSARLQYVYRRPNAGEIDTRYVTAAGSIREVWQGTGPITGLPVYRPMHSFEVPIA